VRRAELEKQQAAIFADAQSRAEKLEGQLVKISQKAGVDGRLFGSVTNTDIAEALNAMGFDVAKADIRMPNGHFKQIGDYPITVALHHEAVANITVSVLGES